jgi:peptide/nickel transport system permease protein
MLTYILKRLLFMIPVILGVTFIVFALMYLTPGDPAMTILGPEATHEELEVQRELMGLNDPFIVQFGRYCYKSFIQFDLGKSYNNNRSVSKEIIARFPNTFKVAGISVIFAVLIGMPLGVMAAVNQYTWKDNASMMLALIGVSMPGFWIALLLVLLFSLKLGWLPPTGLGGWKYYILPCLSIAVHGAGGIARQTRSSMLEVIRQDYVTTAKAKGQKQSKVIYVHALRNALIPVITTIGNMLGIQLGGAMVAESIFSIPGLGMYMVTAIKNRDYPVVQGSVLVIAVVFSVIMLLVDIVFAFVDPRIKARYKKAKKIGKQKTVKGAV